MAVASMPHLSSTCLSFSKSQAMAVAVRECPSQREIYKGGFFVLSHYYSIDGEKSHARGTSCRAVDT
jgi:hypothetical protein